MQLAVTHRYAQVNGLRYHYVEAGEGPLLLLLHGFPESWWSWRHQMETLAAAGHRVIAPDQRGYADTDKQGPYDLDTLVSDACELIRALGAEQADVCGHDWGGAVAWHLAATKPAFVRRLAVLNCPHPAQMATALRTSGRQLRRSWYMFLFQLPWLPERVLPRFLHGAYRKRTQLSDAEIRRFVDEASKPGAAFAMLGWYRAAFRNALKKWFRVPRYDTIAAETLLVWGENDFDLGYDDLVPGTEQYVPRLRVEVVPGAGHFVHEEQPEQVGALLREFFTPAQSSFDVVLSAVGENKIGVIRELRVITGLELTAVKNLIDAVPKTIVSGATRKEAERIRDQLAGLGAIVEIG
jgi:pimeloyl-ACP methyl ester carboxylesterase